MATGNNTAILYITDNGFALAKRLNSLYPNAKAFKLKPDSLSEFWGKYKSFIFIMASGIVIRTVAPLIKDKRTDPAVVVLDEKGKYAISLLSGHLGGANKLAQEIADCLGGQAVITTASDVNGLPSIDLWAKENDLIIDDWNLLPQTATQFINNGTLKVFSEVEIKLPDEFLRVAEPQVADILITNKACHPELVSGSNWMLKQVQHDRNDISDKPFYLRPKNLIIGIGCNSGTSADEIEDAVKRALAEKKLSFLSIHSVATIDIKADEKGLNEFVREYGFPIKTFAADELNSLNGIQKSALVFKATGAYAVVEPAALLASGADKLLVKKQKQGNVTVAIAELHRFTHSPIHPSGRIYIVGTGPGAIEHITPYAQNAIRNSDVIVGYGTYIELIKELIKDKEIVSTEMTQEIERCKKAVELAMPGRTVSVISGGDPGIYAMAGLVFELLKNRNALCVMRNTLKNKNASRVTHHVSRVDVEVIPGISALNACAAKLGAPLMHDFASISLSDRLTPWKLIEKRLDAAAKADFVIILYNPKSKGRAEHIDKTREIILKCRKPETPVGIVKGAMREDERVIVTDLKDMLEHDIDMQTTVIIGNSQTFVWNERMITPRGYEGKLKLES